MLSLVYEQRPSDHRRLRSAAVRLQELVQTPEEVAVRVEHRLHRGVRLLRLRRCFERPQSAVAAMEARQKEGVKRKANNNKEGGGYHSQHPVRCARTNAASP
jgi:hypothetical protein